MRRLLFSILVFIFVSGCPDFPRIGPASVETAWNYYEEGLFDKAIKEFEDVIKSEPENGEAFNGLGWCYSKITLLITSVDDFNLSIQKDSSLVDPYAGLTFSYSDLGEDQNAVHSADSLIEKDSQYFFGHDKDISWQDIVLVKAKSLCNLGDFASALTEVQKLNPSFNCNISTPEGREALLTEIERLRGIV